MAASGGACSAGSSGSAGDPVATRPLVGIVGGSRPDFPVLEKAAAVLAELGIPHELRVISAHRTPGHPFRHAETAAGRGIRVIVAGLGLPPPCPAYTRGVTATREIDDARLAPGLPLPDGQPRGPRAGTGAGAGAIGRRPGPPRSVPETWLVPAA